MKLFKKMLNMKSRTALLINTLALVMNYFVFYVTKVESVFHVIQLQCITEVILVVCVTIDSKYVTEMISEWYRKRLEKRFNKVMKKLEDEEDDKTT